MVLMQVTHATKSVACLGGAHFRSNVQSRIARDNCGNFCELTFRADVVHLPEVGLLDQASRISRKYHAGAPWYTKKCLLILVIPNNTKRQEE